MKSTKKKYLGEYYAILKGIQSRESLTSELLRGRTICHEFQGIKSLISKSCTGNFNCLCITADGSRETRLSVMLHFNSMPISSSELQN